MPRRLTNTVYCLLAAITITSCSFQNNYFSGRGTGDRSQLSELFILLESDAIGEDERFAVCQKISSIFMKQGDTGRFVSFLAGEISKNQNGPYNSRYLLSIAYAYALIDADEIAILYYDRIIKNYADLEVSGESIHFTCLRQLIKLVNDPQKRIDYRRELIARFPSRIDAGAEYFLLGMEYEKTGEWEAAIDSYKKFLTYHDSNVPDYPKASQYARSFIDLTANTRTWVYDSLEELLDRVKRAFDTGDSRGLSRLRAGVGFFAMSWNQDIDLANDQVDFDFGAFMAGRIRYSPTLDPSSGSTEAFLRTTGWTERLPTWYLYFRKIDFPADPEVHGKWEWAGIYFGDKLQ